MSKLNIKYYLDKIFDIDKQLGGKLQIEKGNQAGDEFTIYQQLVQSLIHEINEKNKQRMSRLDTQSQRDQALIKMDLEIKEKIAEASEYLQKMNESLKKMVKKEEPFKVIQAKEKLYFQLNKTLNQIKLVNENEEDDDDYPDDSKGITTLFSNQAKKQGFRTEMNEEEQGAVKQYKQIEKEQDIMIGNINEGALKLKQKCQKMGEAIDFSSNQIDQLNVEVDKTNVEMQNQNQALKKVITELRKPGRFCIDIILIIVLLGLVGYIAKMLF